MDIDLTEILEKIFDFVQNYAPIIGIAIKILFTLIIKLYSSLSRKKKIYYTIKTEKIKPHGKITIIENLPITNYDNIDRIKSISTIFIWSDKHNTIDGEYDIDTKCLPCISLLNENIIFGARLLNESTTPDFNQAHIFVDRNSCKLIFKQINHCHGLTIQIAHSAEKNKQISFTSNMNVEKTRKIVVAKWFDIKLALGLLITIDVITFICGLFSYFNATNESDDSISYSIYMLIILITTIVWIFFNVKQCLLPSFVRKGFEYR